MLPCHLLGLPARAIPDAARAALGCVHGKHVWSVTRRDRADLETGIIVNDVKAGVLLGEPPAAPPLMLASTARSTIARGNAGERTTNRFIPTLRLIAPAARVQYAAALKGGWRQHPACGLGQRCAAARRPDCRSIIACRGS
jgi:hypothetical protein